MYTLADIAQAGAAAVAVTATLTQAAKRLLEMRVPPTDARHDPLVEALSVAIGVLVVLVATLATTPLAPFTPGWWQAVVTAIVAGLGIKLGSSGMYRLLVGAKVDPPALLAEAATLLEAQSAPATVTVTPAPAPAPPVVEVPAGPSSTLTRTDNMVD